jgi:hypothetical protein
MSHGIILPKAIAAQNIDAWIRSAICESDVDNGNVVLLTGLSSTSGEGEVWEAIAPSTDDGLTGVWIAYEPELVWTGDYRGLDPDTRNFYNVSDRVFTVFKPAIGDIITLTGDALYGSKGSNGYLNCTNTAGLELAWAATAGSSIFAAKLLGTTYISLAVGSIDEQRVTAYDFEVVAL